MLDAASRREFDVLLFWSLDRLTREGALATLKYLELLTSYGVGYRSFTEAYLDSSARKRMEDFFGSVFRCGHCKPRESFLEELFQVVAVPPLTLEVERLARRIHGEQMDRE